MIGACVERQRPMRMSASREADRDAGEAQLSKKACELLPQRRH